MRIPASVYRCGCRCEDGMGTILTLVATRRQGMYVTVRIRRVTIKRQTRQGTSEDEVNRFVLKPSYSFIENEKVKNYTLLLPPSTTCSGCLSDGSWEIEVFLLEPGVLSRFSVPCFLRPQSVKDPTPVVTMKDLKTGQC